MPFDAPKRDWLFRNFEGRIKLTEPLSGHTSFRIGGPADALVWPASLEALRMLVKWCVNKNLKFIILGDGTNLLFSDAGFRGIVISLRKIALKIRVLQSEADATRIGVPAGVRTASVCRYAVSQGLDLNFALGIPGTIGGAVSMNAGTRLGAFENVVWALSVLLQNGEMCHLNKNQITFAYRKLNLNLAEVHSCPPIIWEIELKLKKGDPKKIAETSRAFLKQRKASQPVNDWSAGCFFKNPDGNHPAGKLIDQVGLKGKTWGQAKISEKHANFIVNTGNATADDVLKLMRLAQTEVLERFGVTLEPEVKIVNE